jgi:hypothetical protein
VTISKQEYDKINDSWNNPTMKIIKVDDCEYMSFYPGTDRGFTTHKGNCKFCQQRLETTIRKILEEEKQTK